MNPKRIDSLQNPLIKHLTKLHQNREYRYEQSSVVIEGKKMVEEISQEKQILTLLVREGDVIPSIQAKVVYVVPNDLLRKISSTLTPEGILAEVSMPPFISLQNKKRIIVLDEINDPGNMGNLLRSALALGWEGAFILPNSCDPFNDKALRAAKGATFRLPMAYGDWNELIAMQKGIIWQNLAADLEGITPEKIPQAERRLLIFGNEAKGISEKAEKISKKVSIPMHGKMESLNVSAAGAILMYLLGGR